jgi:hypothetical protein
MSSASGSSCRRGTSPRGAKPSKNDEDELQRAHQLNNAVQKKLLWRPAIQKSRVDTPPFRGPLLGSLHLALLGFSSKLLLETKCCARVK